MLSCGDFKNNYSKDIAVLNEIVLCIKLTRVTNFAFQKNNYEHAEKIIMHGSHLIVIRNNRLLLALIF